MNEHAVRWIRTMPWRWAFCGVVLAALIAALYGVTNRGLRDPFDLVGLLVAIPAGGLVGFIWGWSERFDFERRQADSLERLQDAYPYGLRQAGKGLVAGLLFGAFTAVPLALLEGGQPAGRDLFRFAIPGIVLGIAVGAASRRSLQQRLAAEPGQTD
jgi:hypothetical protein